MNLFGTAPLLLSSLWAPYLLRLLYCLGLTIIAGWGYRDLRSRGWLLLSIAGALSLLRQVAWAYPNYLLASRGPSEYGRAVMWFSGLDSLLMPISSCLLLIGLLSLLAEQRRRSGTAKQ